ncbi:MAG: hypothetical protein PWP31_94 [Clostridia bacterium]|nr:hypothetical protein [Clostridia bacterium]
MGVPDFSTICTLMTILVSSLLAFASFKSANAANRATKVTLDMAIFEKQKYIKERAVDSKENTGLALISLVDGNTYKAFVELDNQRNIFCINLNEYPLAKYPKKNNDTETVFAFPLKLYSMENQKLTGGKIWINQNLVETIIFLPKELNLEKDLDL